MGNSFQVRINKLQDLIQDSDFDLVAVSASPSQVYFSGLHFHISERPAILLVGKKNKPAFIFPGLESEKVKKAKIELEPFPYQESRADWVKTFKNAMEFFQSGDIRIGVEPTAMRYLELELLGLDTSRISFTSAAQEIETLRAKKDQQEIASIRKAIHIAEQALMNTIPTIKAGITEVAIANALVINLLRAGSDPDLPFFPIIASGPNSANPHAVPGDRPLEIGDLLVIDWGARYHGYISDITRTFGIGKISPQLKEIYNVVKRANQTARDISTTTVKSGQAIDQVARTVISDAGFGSYFIHRTGHGFGLEAHEAPFIAEDSEQVIQPGMTFSIEPGIYIPGQGGVRIEDDICARDGKLETLTTLDRKLTIL